MPDTEEKKTPSKPTKRRTTRKTTTRKRKTTAPKKKKEVVNESVNETFSSKPLFRVLIVLVLLFGVLVLLAGISQLGKGDPQDHIESMIETAFSDEVQTGKVKGEVRVDIPLSQTPPFTQKVRSTILIDGQFDISDEETFKEQFSINYKAQLPEDSMEFDADLIVNEKEMFIKMDEIDGLGEVIEFLSPDYFNSWIHVNPSVLSEMYGIDIPVFSVSSVQIKNMRKAFKEAKDLFKVKDVKGEEDYEGVRVSKYLVTMDTKAVSEMMDRFYGDDTMEMMSFNEQQLRALLNTINESGIELWVGNNDNYLYRMRFNIVGDNRQLPVSMSFDFQYSDYNDPVEITLPTEFLSLEEIISSITQELEKQQRSQVQARIEDHAQYSQLYEDDLVLECGDLVFDSEDGDIRELILTPSLDSDSTYALSGYVTKTDEPISQELYLQCQDNDDYIPVIVNLPENYMMWTPKSFWEDDGPCGDVLELDESQEQQACFDAIFELQVFAVESVPGQ